MGPAGFEAMKRRSFEEAVVGIKDHIRSMLKVKQETNPANGDHVFTFEIGVMPTDEIDKLRFTANQKMSETNWDLRGRNFQLECRLYDRERTIGRRVSEIVAEVLQDQLEGTAEFMGRR